MLILLEFPVKVVLRHPYSVRRPSGSFFGFSVKDTPLVHFFGFLSKWSSDTLSVSDIPSWFIFWGFLSKWSQGTLSVSGTSLVHFCLGSKWSNKTPFSVRRPSGSFFGFSVKDHF